jgi:hypothetical protein
MVKLHLQAIPRVPMILAKVSVPPLPDNDVRFEVQIHVF